MPLGTTREIPGLFLLSAAIAPVAPVATFEGDANDGASQYQNIVAGNVVSFVGANHNGRNKSATNESNHESSSH